MLHLSTLNIICQPSAQIFCMSLIFIAKHFAVHYASRFAQLHNWKVYPVYPNPTLMYIKKSSRLCQDPRRELQCTFLASDKQSFTSTQLIIYPYLFSSFYAVVSILIMPNMCNLIKWLLKVHINKINLIPLVDPFFYFIKKLCQLDSIYLKHIHLGFL